MDTQSLATMADQAIGLDAGAAFKVAIFLGLGTLMLRIGGGDLRRHLTLHPSIERALTWLPVAALAAMITPTFAPTAENGIDFIALGAAGVTAWVSYKTRNLLLSIGAGLLVFGLLSF